MVEVTAEDLDKLIETGEQIIKNSKRDLLVWEGVVESARKRKEELESRSMADEDIELPE